MSSFDPRTPENAHRSADSSGESDAGDSVGTRIRAARRERGWTQDQLAAAVGVSRSAVAQWETDRAGQIRANLARIANALGVSLESLIKAGTPAEETEPASRGDELAILRLYRACAPEDRTLLLRTARRLARHHSD